MVTKGKVKLKPVVVTTVHKGVFFGYTDGRDGEEITLEQCRMCIYWSADTRGVLGLAANGPGAGCRISPPAPAALLTGVTAVINCTIEAAKAWENAPWG